MAEAVITEQGDLINEYHLQLKASLEKNENLLKQIEYLKKERRPTSQYAKSSEKSKGRLNSSALMIQENSFDKGISLF